MHTDLHVSPSPGDYVPSPIIPHPKKKALAPLLGSTTVLLHEPFGGFNSLSEGA